MNKDDREKAAMTWLIAREINCPEVHTILAMLEELKAKREKDADATN